MVLFVALFLLNEGVIPGFLLVGFFPGYVVVASLYPNHGGLSWMERLLLSIVLSIALLPLLALILNFTPFGIRFLPLVASVAIFTIVVGLIAYRRRTRLPIQERLSGTLSLSLPNWKVYTLFDKVLTLALSGVLVIAAAAFVSVVTAPRQRERFTEFYLFSSDGSDAGYPTRLNVSQLAALIIGITNHENSNENFTVRVDLVGVKIVYNQTASINETVELNRTTRSWINVSLAIGQNWTYRYTFSIGAAGVWELQFFLFANREPSVFYRELHLYVTVS